MFVVKSVYELMGNSHESHSRWLCSGMASVMRHHDRLLYHLAGVYPMRQRGRRSGKVSLMRYFH